MKLRQDIKKLSTIGFAGLIVSVIISFFVENYLLNQIEQNRKMDQNIENTYNNIYTFNYHTELLLNSYNFQEVKKLWYKAITVYQKDLDHFIQTNNINKEIITYNNSIKTKIEDISKSLNSIYFSEKNNMEKPLLVRLGELTVMNNNNEYFIEIRNLVDKIEHIKQYQTFLLQDINAIKLKVKKKVKKEIGNLQILLVLFPVISILFLTFFSVFISAFIRKSEMEIINTKNLLENIMNSIPIRIFWKDLDGVYSGANKIFLEDCSLKSISELINKTDNEMPWRDTQAKSYREADLKVINTQQSILNIKERQQRAKGTIAYLNTSKVPMRDHENNIIGVIGLYEDITSQVKNEALIKEQEIQLIKQSRLAQMGEMISMIAHQWRQPLNVISTISGLIRLKINNIEKEEIESRLIQIENQTTYLSNTINDFRDFFKPDKAKNEIFVQDLIEKTLNIISSNLKSSNIKIIKDFQCDEKLFIHQNEVMQVLLNIIKNAQDALLEKKIENPMITISAKCGINTTCLITIEDNGGGIDENIIDSIFDPYFSTKGEKNGTGLGLYMSKTIIENHCNGKLEVENGKDGAIFYITI